MEDLAKAVEEKVVIVSPETINSEVPADENAPVKKKRVVKGVRFNLETKRPENGEKAVKFI